MCTLDYAANEWPTTLPGIGNYYRSLELVVWLVVGSSRLAMMMATDYMDDPHPPPSPPPPPPLTICERDKLHCRRRPFAAARRVAQFRLTHSTLGAEVGVDKGKASKLFLVDATHHVVRHWRQYWILFGELCVKVQRILGAPLMREGRWLVSQSAINRHVATHNLWLERRTNFPLLQ